MKLSLIFTSFIILLLMVKDTNTTKSRNLLTQTTSKSIFTQMGFDSSAISFDFLNATELISLYSQQFDKVTNAAITQAITRKAQAQQLTFDQCWNIFLRFLHAKKEGQEIHQELQHAIIFNIQQVLQDGVIKHTSVKCKVEEGYITEVVIRFDNILKRALAELPKFGIDLTGCVPLHRMIADLNHRTELYDIDLSNNGLHSLQLFAGLDAIQPPFTTLFGSVKLNLEYNKFTEINYHNFGQFVAGIAIFAEKISVWLGNNPIHGEIDVEQMKLVQLVQLRLNNCSTVSSVVNIPRMNFTLDGPFLDVSGTAIQTPAQLQFADGIQYTDGNKKLSKNKKLCKLSKLLNIYLSIYNYTI